MDEIQEGVITITAVLVEDGSTRTRVEVDGDMNTIALLGHMRMAESVIMDGIECAEDEDE